MAEKRKANNTPAPAGWEDVIVDQFRFEKVGDSVQGILLAKESSSFGVGAYQIQVDADHSVSILGTTGLDRLLAQVAEGIEVFIEFMDIQKTGANRNFKVFRVLRKPAA
jgi:hypothetical protein